MLRSKLGKPLAMVSVSVAPSAIASIWPRSSGRDDAEGDASTDADGGGSPFGVMAEQGNVVDARGPARGDPARVPRRRRDTSRSPRAWFPTRPRGPPPLLPAPPRV